MVIEDMQCLQAVVVATSLSMNERFTLLAEMSAFQRAAPPRTRRISTNEGPIFSTNLRAMPRRVVDDESDPLLGLDRSVEDNHSRAGSMSRSRAGSMPRSQAGSMPRSRAGSMSRHSGEGEMPGLVRSNSWGRLSRANSVGNLSLRSGQSGRSSGGQSHHSRAMSFKGPDLNQRLQMRDAWMRQRNVRARGRGHGRGRRGYMQWNQQRGHWNNPQRRWGLQHQRGQQWWQQRWSRQQWLRQQQGRQQWFNQQQGRQQWLQQQGRVRLWRWGSPRNNMPPLTPRGRAGQENPGYVHKRGGAGRGMYRARGRGRGGRGGQHTVAGVENGASVFHPTPQNMPALKTKEELDKELDEYMASTPATLDKELDQYMAQSGLSMDSE